MIGLVVSHTDYRNYGAGAKMKCETDTYEKVEQDGLWQIVIIRQGKWQSEYFSTNSKMSCNVTIKHDKCILHYITLHYFGVIKSGLMDATVKPLYILYKTTEQLDGNSYEGQEWGKRQFQVISNKQQAWSEVTSLGRLFH